MVRLAGPQLLNFWGIIWIPSIRDLEGNGIGVVVGVGRGVNVSGKGDGDASAAGDGLLCCSLAVCVSARSSMGSLGGTTVGPSVGTITSICWPGCVAIANGNADGSGVTT